MLTRKRCWRMRFHLACVAADAHSFFYKEKQLKPTIGKVLVYPGSSQPPFSTLEEAKRAFVNTQLVLQPAPFVGDSVVDVLLHYQHDGAVPAYQIASSLNPGLPGQDETANLILDYRDGVQHVHRVNGLMTEPVLIDRSVWAAARTFIVDGLRHIFTGYDHVLFVVCLVLGALSFASLVWRVTGFTIGHSITLALGFFGYTPAAVWFIPLVEAGIALSIVAAAVYALTNRTRHNMHQSIALLVTALIGMLHGLGFSFLLKEILGVNAANVWVSLLSFNLGVEIGQLAIVLLLWPLLWSLRHYKKDWFDAAKWVIAMPCIAIASVWFGERLISLLAVLQNTTT